MTKESTIHCINIYLQNTKDCIIDYESLASQDIDDLHRKEFLQNIIAVNKLQILLLNAILKNNKSLYDKIAIKIKEKATNALENIDESCQKGSSTEKFYLGISKKMMNKIELLDKLILFVQRVDLS